MPGVPGYQHHLTKKTRFPSTSTSLHTTLARANSYPAQSHLAGRFSVPSLFPSLSSRSVPLCLSFLRAVVPSCTFPADTWVLGYLGTSLPHFARFGLVALGCLMCLVWAGWSFLLHSSSSSFALTRPSPCVPTFFYCDRAVLRSYCPSEFHVLFHTYPTPPALSLPPHSLACFCQPSPTTIRHRVVILLLFQFALLTTPPTA